jgi:hypothetical protein
MSPENILNAEDYRNSAFYPMIAQAQKYDSYGWKTGANSAVIQTAYDVKILAAKMSKQSCLTTKPPVQRIKCNL